MKSLTHKDTTVEVPHGTEVVHSHCSKLDENDSCANDKSQSQVNDPSISNDKYVLTLWKNKKISINKSLVLMRIALFLWFGAARLPSLFLSIFMKSRGLTLIEYSTAFSFIFLIQFILSSVSGVIADKIGKGKPILLFYVLATIVILFGMLLTPNVNTQTCQIEENLNCSDLLKNNASSTFCFINCFQNVTQNYDNKENSAGSRTNVSLVKYSDTYIDRDVKNISNGFLQFVDSDSCNEICTTLCAVPLESECITTRSKFLVVLYSIWIFSTFSFRSIAYRFMDITALFLISTTSSYYGRERAFAITGEIFVSIFVAFILNIDKSPQSNYNYDSVLWFADAILLCSFLFVCCVRVPKFPPGENLLQKASVFSRDINFWAFAFVVYVAGNGFTFNLNFHFILLQSMKAPKIIFGLLSIIYGIYGIPVLLTSRWWLNKLDTHNIFILCFVCYSLNHAAYSFLYNPWMALLIEVTFAFTFHLFWVAVVIHGQRTAPQGFVATFLAVAGALHYGIGRSSGVLFGGLLINYLGQRMAYRVTASFFLLVALLYSLFIFMRRKYSEKAVEENGTAEETPGTVFTISNLKQK